MRDDNKVVVVTGCGTSRSLLAALIASQPTMIIGDDLEQRELTLREVKRIDLLHCVEPPEVDPRPFKVSRGKGRKTKDWQI